MSLGKYVKELRELKGLSQRDLAKNILIDSTQISKIENDRVIPSDNLIKLLADELGVKTNDLLYRAGKMRKYDRAALRKVIQDNPDEMAEIFKNLRAKPTISTLTKTTESNKIKKLRKELSIAKKEKRFLESKLAYIRKKVIDKVGVEEMI